MSTSIHEAYPGHYVQFLHLNASPATKVEKIFGSYAFIEGWAHYYRENDARRRLRRDVRKIRPREEKSAGREVSNGAGR